MFKIKFNKRFTMNAMFLIHITFSLICVVQCYEVCDIHATIIRRVESEGFHRELHSLVEIVTGYSTLWGKCKVVLEEVMPSGLFVNPDQLADLQRFDQVQACPIGTIDTEAPERTSLPHTVQVYSNLTRTENLLSALLTLPFHVRYHSPVPHGGYTTVELGAPSLLLQCKHDIRCVQGQRVLASCQPCGQEMCQWVNLSYKTNSPSINMHVPVGNASHQGFITIVTLLVTCGGCVYILSVLAETWSNSPTAKCLRHEEQCSQQPATSSCRSVTCSRSYQGCSS